MRVRSVACVAIGTLIGAGHALPSQLTTVDAAALYRSISPSVFVIEIHSATDSVIALGSGFLVADGRLATNAHVVNGGRPFLRIGAVALPLAIERIDAINDLAIVRSEMRLDARPLALASTEPAIGTRIWAIGNPKGLERSMSEGLVSGIRDRSNRQLLQISAAISPGSSGGPVVSATGEVVGVAVGFLEGGQNLNFAVPANAVRRLLASRSSATDFDSALSEVKRIWADLPADISDTAAWSAHTRVLQGAFDNAALSANQGAQFLDLAAAAVQAVEEERALKFAEEALRRHVQSPDSARILKIQAWYIEALFLDSTDAVRLRPMLALVDSVLVRRPRNAWLYYFRAELLYRLMRGQEAIQSARRAVSLGVADTANIGTFYESLHRVTAGNGSGLADDRVFQEEITAGVSTMWEWHTHGDHLKKRREWEAAGNAYLRAAQLGAKQVAIGYFCEAGEAYWTASKLDAALGAFRSCLNSSVGSATLDTAHVVYAHQAISSILNNRGVYAEAESHARQALALDPTNAWASLALSNALRSQQRPSEAAAAAEQAIRLSDGSYSLMHFVAGLAYFDLKDWPRCVRAFEKVMELSSSDDGAPYNAGLCYANQSFFADAARMMTEAIRRNPKRSDRAEIERMIRQWRP